MNTSEHDPAWWKQMPPVGRRLAVIALSLAAGFAVAVLLHYLLYRVGLPSRPFIYVAF